MKTENVLLNIKEIFDKKKVKYHKHDIALMRYLCKQFIAYVLESQRHATRKNGLPLEKGQIRTETVRDRGFYGKN